MSPEEELLGVVSELCPDCGHWPYTRDATLYVGWRSAEDEAVKAASNRTIRMAVRYDVAVCCDRTRLPDAETLRYQLYDALRKAGWMLDGPAGPEVFSAQTAMYLWPFTVAKAFALDEGAPVPIT